MLLGLTVVSFEIFHKKSDLDNTGQEIVTALRMAQNKTLASEGAGQFGLYFNNTTSPHQYVLFKGSTYVGRDPSFDQVSKLSNTIEISNINLTDSEVVFNRVEGSVSSEGDLEIRVVVDPSQTKTIFIDQSGLVGFSSLVTPGTGRTIDARHVHFDLGWTIQNASTLKFYFPSIPQTETIEMTAYFNPGKTEFDWEGSFEVGGIDQVFKVHTHLLDNFDTLLSVHRDRTEGQTDQEVIFYIVDSGTDKEIAHYLADGSDTVNVGLYGGVMEIQ